MKINHKRQTFRHFAMRNTALGGDPEGGGGDPAPGSADPAPGGTGDPSPQTVANFLEGNELAADPALANYLSGDVAALAKGFVSTKKLVGADPSQLVKLPTGVGDEHKDAWGEVYGKLGRPDDPAGYTSPEGFDDNRDALQISDELVGDFGKMAHALGLSNSQYQGVLGFYGDMAQSAAATMQETEGKAAEDRAAALEGLKQEWGEGYDKNVGMALQAIKTMGDDATDFVKMLDETGLGDNPALIKLFAKVGEGLQEDAGGGNGKGDFSQQLTPESARAKISDLQADPEFVKRWTNADEAGHDEAVARMNRLNQQAFPQQRAG